MKNGRHIIWSNDIDYDDWREDLEEQYPDLTEAERMEWMYELNGDYLDDERSNLDIQLSRPILVVGDLGLRKFRAAISGTAFTANGILITALGMWIKTVTSAAMPSITMARTIIFTVPIRTA